MAAGESATVGTETDALSPRERRYHRVTLAMSAGALLFALALVPKPETDGIHTELMGLRMPTLCLYRATSGMDCPACGLTRSFMYLVRGDVTHAVRCNPLGPLFFLIVVLQIPYRLVVLGAGRRPPDIPERWRSVVRNAVLAGVVLLWAARTVPQFCALVASL